MQINVKKGQSFKNKIFELSMSVKV